MANAELYDYLSTVSADVDQTLSIDPQSVLTETITKNDLVNEGDDRSEERAEFTGDFIAYVVIRYDLLSASDSGTIIDFFYNSSKGNGLINSFKFSHPDGHTYVVRFDTDLTRLINPAPSKHSIKNIKLKILGRIAD